MVELFAKIRHIAPSRANVLITGESGTGKELVAFALHNLSPRASKNFVPVNCAALVESLAESELFGHERGAFTGAVRQKKGYFEEADQGTIFLDEIGVLNLNLQAKLLRVLEQREFERVGRMQAVPLGKGFDSKCIYVGSGAIPANKAGEYWFYYVGTDVEHDATRPGKVKAAGGIGRFRITLSDTLTTQPEEMKD